MIHIYFKLILNIYIYIYIYINVKKTITDPQTRAVGIMVIDRINTMIFASHFSPRNWTLTN